MGPFVIPAASSLSGMASSIGKLIRVIKRTTTACWKAACMTI